MEVNPISDFMDTHNCYELTPNLVKISEDDFFLDYSKCKRMIDAGLDNAFVLLNSTSLTRSTRISGTKISDIEEMFGRDALSLFRFAFYPGDDFVDNPEYVQSVRIRRLTDSDKRRMRGTYRYYPQNCYVCEWADATGFVVVIPFVQDANGQFRWLVQSRTARYAKDKKYAENSTFSQDTLPGIISEEIVNIIPDILGCNLALIRYKDVDFVIPVDKQSAKYTFKNRDKEDGKKKRLIHTVKSHYRKNLVNEDSVDSHIRGTSSLTIKGVEIKLLATFDQAIQIIKSERKK